MLKVVEVKETVKDSNLIQDMYGIEILIKYIIKSVEIDGELNYDDYNYISIVLGKAKQALQKVNEIINI